MKGHLFALALGWVAATPPALAIDLFGQGSASDPAQWKRLPGPASAREVRESGIDAGIVERIGAATGAPPELLHGRSGKAAPPIGLVWSVPSAEADALVAGHRQALAAEGYSIFLAERGFGVAPDRLAVAPVKDPLDPVVLRGTSGRLPEIPNSAIVAKLREWGRKIPYDLVGAGSDWLEIELRALPESLAPFVAELHELAPAAASPESREDFEREITRTRRVFLWWK